VFVAVGAEPGVRVASRRLLALGDRDPGAFRDRRLVPLDLADARSLGWTDPSHRRYLVRRAENLPWVGGPHEEPGPLGESGHSGYPGTPVKGERVDEGLRHLLALRIERFVEPPPVGDSSQGQSQGQGRVELVADGSTEVLTMTDLPCAGNGVVVARELDHRREGTCVEAVALAALWPSLEGAADPDHRLLHSPPDTVAAIDLFDAQHRVGLRRAPGSWVFVDPRPAYGVDAEAVGDWLEALRHARCDNAPNRAADRHLLIEARYRERCDVASSQAAYRLLTPDPLRFRDRVSLSFARIDARRLRRITRGPTGVTEVVSEDGGSWRVGAPIGARVDRSGIDRVIGALADLRARSFRAEAPPGQPQVSLEVDVQGPGDGTAVRHRLVLFAAGAGPCTARLDGETTLSITRAACEELRLPLLESEE
jgi:hypothetical protein